MLAVERLEVASALDLVQTSHSAAALLFDHGGVQARFRWPVRRVERSLDRDQWSSDSSGECDDVEGVEHFRRPGVEVVVGVTVGCPWCTEGVAGLGVAVEGGVEFLSEGSLELVPEVAVAELPDRLGAGREACVEEDLMRFRRPGGVLRVLGEGRRKVGGRLCSEVTISPLQSMPPS